jgi:adenine-specific DNA-methyltransferase
MTLLPSIPISPRFSAEARIVLHESDDGWVMDPFLGVGTSIIAALRHGRRGAGAEIMGSYAATARNRIEQAVEGTLRVRPMNKPVFDPKAAGKSLTESPWRGLLDEQEEQMMLLEDSNLGPGEKSARRAIVG